MRNFRDEIEEILKESPSLKSYLKENYPNWYKSSVTAKSEEFFIPKGTFIELETILQSNYFG